MRVDAMRCAMGATDPWADVRRLGSSPPSTYSGTADTVSCMKTTLNIDDTIMAELKHGAARQGRTLSELVETA